MSALISGLGSVAVLKPGSLTMDPNMHIYPKSQRTWKIQKKLEQLQAQMLLYADQVSQ